MKKGMRKGRKRGEDRYLAQQDEPSASIIDSPHAIGATHRVKEGTKEEEDEEDGGRGGEGRGERRVPIAKRG